MPEKIIKLKDRKIICENTIGIWFDRTDVEYDFEPGQYAKITLLEPIQGCFQLHLRPRGRIF